MNLTFVIANEGNTTAASVSVGYRIFVFDKKQKKVMVAMEAGRVFSPGAIYKELLKPAQYESMGLVSLNQAENLLAVYQFDLKYFRESDMKEYSREDYFFVNSGHSLTHSEFRSDPLYRDVMAEISRTVIPHTKWDPGTMSKYIEAQSINKS